MRRLPWLPSLFLLLASLVSGHALGQSPPATGCASGQVFDDRNGNGHRDPGEPGLADIGVSDGHDVVRTDAGGRYRLAPSPGRTVFVIKPPGWRFGTRTDGLPDFWRHQPDPSQPALRYGGIQPDASPRGCGIALRREQPPARRSDGLQVVVFGDPQPKSMVDVGHYARGIIDPLLESSAVSLQRASSMRLPGEVADLGLSLGDIVDDDLSLYPSVNRETARLGVPWLHAPGNHDMDLDAADDAHALLSFRNVFGPDTLAWEEPEASFIVLDNVIHLPGQRPAYTGGLREDQFAFLSRYLRDARRDRLLVLAMHVPLFEEAGRDTFRDADRERLFALLRPFPHVLLLTAHRHTQQHVFHGPDSGWHGVAPLHEYNVGATCGAFWSGIADAHGVPVSTMADGTPRGWARLDVRDTGAYALRYQPADDPLAAMHLHAPKVLRQGAYPAWAVYANLHMGIDGDRVEYRIGEGPWQPMQRVERADPALLAENARDDLADALRSHDRSPEAEPSRHVWRGRLPTDLAAGEHRIEVRAFDRWRGEVGASTMYRLENAEP
ncbi:MAG: calcineurin-like phosphoesterase family protein [Pseudoxanthomonas suwonensis]|nr:calcineurin-like phosphoesterase family protein [Pseudoxanthomonas suwonensis]